MSYVSAAALVTRLREVLEDSCGAYRTIPVGRFAGDLVEGLSEGEQTRRAFSTARVRADVRVGKRSKYSPPINGNVAIYEIEVPITVLRTVTRKDQLSPSENDEVMSASLEDVDVVRQALEYPGNLLTTQGGTATGLVSGMLAFDRSDQSVTRTVNQGAQLLEQRLLYRGWLKSTPTITAPASTVAPVASGTVSLASTLSCTTGTWSGAPLSYAYQWRRDMRLIGAAALATYVVTAADVGRSITCAVTATNAGGGTTAPSNALT